MTHVFDIKGSCVTREAVAQSKKIKVNKYLFRKPITMLNGKAFEDKTLEKNMVIDLINGGAMDYVIRQIPASFQKYHFLENDHAPKIIIDFIDERMRVVDINKHLIEYTPEVRNLIDKYHGKIINPRKQKNYLDEVGKFINSLIAIYGEKNVIINRAFATYFTKVGDNLKFISTIYGKLEDNNYSIERINQDNKYLLAIYDYLNKQFPNLNYIDLALKNIYTPLDHRLTPSYYHYDEITYNKFNQKLIDENFDTANSDTYQANIRLLNYFFELTKLINQMPPQNFNNEYLLCYRNTYDNNLTTMISYHNNCLLKGVGMNRLFLYYRRAWKVRLDFDGNDFELHYKVNDKLLKLLSFIDNEIIINKDLIKHTKIQQDNILMTINDQKMKLASVKDAINKKFIYIYDTDGTCLFTLVIENNQLSFIKYTYQNKIIYLRFKEFINYHQVSELSVYDENKKLLQVDTYCLNSTLSTRLFCDKDEKMKYIYRNNQLDKKIYIRNNRKEKIEYFNEEEQVVKILMFKDDYPVYKEINKNGELLQYKRSEKTDWELIEKGN